MSGNTEPERPADGKPRGSRFAGLVGLVEVLRSERGSLDGYDVVLELPEGVDVPVWSAVEGVTWLLTRLGPYGMDVTDVRARIAAGPPGT